MYRVPQESDYQAGRHFTSQVNVRYTIFSPKRQLLYLTLSF